MYSPGLWLIFSILFLVSFIQQKIVISVKLIYVYSFMDCAFGVASEKSLPNLGSKRFSLMLFQKFYNCRI